MLKHYQRHKQHFFPQSSGRYDTCQNMAHGTRPQQLQQVTACNQELTQKYVFYLLLYYHL